MRRQLILAGTWILLMAFRHHAFSCICADFPACCFVFCLLEFRVVLAWRCLEALGLLKLKITTHFSSDSPSCFFFLSCALNWTIASGSWLLLLLFSVRLPHQGLAHRELWIFKASECASHVGAGTWRLGAQFAYIFA